MLSPFSVFLSRGVFAQIPPLSGDEDFGLVTGKDLTRIVSLEAYSCVECGRCMEHCPANATGKELNPKEIVLGLRGERARSAAARAHSPKSTSVSAKAGSVCIGTCPAMS